MEFKKKISHNLKQLVSENLATVNIEFSIIVRTFATSIFASNRLFYVSPQAQTTIIHIKKS